MTIEKLQETVDEYIKNHGGYFDILTNMTILMEEVGELASILARVDGQQIAKEGDSLNYADELADVLWVLMCIANIKDVNMTKALHDNIVKKCKRDATRYKC